MFNMTLGLLVTLTFLFVMSVRGQSTLGRRFFITAPLYTEHKSLITLFTYNYDVTVQNSYFLMSPQCNPVVNFTKREELFLDRHVPHLMEIDASEIMARCKTRVYFYLIFVGTDDFGVSVMYRGSNGSTATYTAYPLGAYGKSYRIFLLRTNQYYGLFVPKKGSRIYMPGNFSVDRLRWVDTANDVENEYKAMYLCDRSDISKMDPRSIIAKNLTVSNNAALFTGNCYTKADLTTNETCDTLSDATLEMMLSTEHAALHFIVFHVGPRSASSSYAAAVAVDKVVDVTILNEDDQNKTYHVNLGEFVEIPIAYNEFQVLKGTVVFQAYVVTASGCVSDKGTPSMTTVIPTLLFFNQYIWSVPAKHVSLESLDLILIKKTKAVYGFQFDNKDLTVPGWKRVKGDPDYSGAIYKLYVNEEVHTLISSQGRPFGCYMYGSGDTRSFLHFVGFMTAEIYQPWQTCQPSKMTPGDLKDNDCDGLFDEESSNKTDDDGDGNTGEDVILQVPAFFNKFSQTETRPPPPVITEATTMTPWIWEEATEFPPEDHSLPLLLLVLLLIPILSAMLYYMLKKKREPLQIAEELELGTESWVDEPPKNVISKSSQAQSLKQGSVYSQPGQPTSIYTELF